jgi:hypothetical protein
VKRYFPLLATLILLLLILAAVALADNAPADCPIGNICLTPGHGDIVHCEGGVMDVQLVDNQTAVLFCEFANYQAIVPSE